MTVEEVKATAYVYAYIMNKTSTNKIDLYEVHKARPSYQNQKWYNRIYNDDNQTIGVYKAKVGYQVTITRKEILKIWESVYGIKYNGKGGLSIADLISELQKACMIPVTKVYFSNGNWIPEYDFRLYEDDHEVKVIIYTKSQFAPADKTKGEIEQDIKEEERNRLKPVNALFFKDNIVKVLADKGYNIQADPDVLRFSTKTKEYNKLVMDSLEYYINEVLLKDLGCKITIPKVSSQHVFRDRDILCYIGDIQMVAPNEGEQNEL